MKHFLFALLSFVVCLSGHAQTNDKNFSIVDGNKLIWQKIYESDLTAKEIQEVFSSDKHFLVKRGTDTDLILELFPVAVDYSHLKIDRGLVPIYVSINDISGLVTIQFKEGRYRVTVEDISLVNQGVAGHVVTGGVQTRLERYAVGKGIFKKAFLRYPAVIYDDFFSNLFEIVLVEKPFLDNNW